MDVLDESDRLEAAATEGPWVVRNPRGTHNVAVKDA